jgi:hypothetical protein
LSAVISTISRNSIVGNGKGKTGVAKRRAVIRNVGLNSGGSDNRERVVRTCTCNELDIRKFRRWTRVETGDNTYSTVCPDLRKRET